MTTTFEVGKTYKTIASISNFMMRTACKVVERTAETITLVEEYEETPVVVPVQRLIDNYGNLFEFAKYLGDNLYSY